MTNGLSSLTRKVVISLFTVLVLVDAGTIARGYIRPANPTMDYVPQNVGIYDTYYENFKEPDCRACHGSSTAERHHGTQYALQGDCLYCHSEIPGVVPPERDCKVCHVDAGPVGDLGFPHHNSDLADSDQCTACHDPNLLVETNTVEPPTYEPTSITPTPYACENCHWPSGSVAHEAATYDGSTANFLSDWYFWNLAGIGPKPTTWPDSLAHPQPIEANGQVDVGVILWSGGYNRSGKYMPAKPYRPLSGTHHEVDSLVYWKCYNCHSSSPEAYPSWDPGNPFLIRYCENCHDVGTLHAIAEHVTSNNIYRVAGLANQTVTANEKCIACHGDYLPVLPPLPAEVPKIWSMEPDFGSAGIIVSITPTFDGAFGNKMNADRVLVGQADPGTGCGSIEYQEVPIYSWTADEILFRIPGWTFEPGNLCVRVRKQTLFGIKTSPVFADTFNLREHPVIYNLNPDGGTLSTSPIEINGNGFGVKRERVYLNNYGYSTYVEFHASNDRYRVTKYPAWSKNQIKIKLLGGSATVPPKIYLLDVKNGNVLIDPAQFYEGCWEVYVMTDFFRDDGDGVYLKSKTADPITGPLGTIDSEDELLYREISDPVCFNSADSPYINSVKPSKPGSPKIGRVRHGNTVRIYGVNFGPTKHAADKVYICDDNACAVKTSVATTSWSNTLIKFNAPSPGGYPATRWVSVHVNGAATPDSNTRKLIIRG